MVQKLHGAVKTASNDMCMKDIGEKYFYAFRNVEMAADLQAIVAAMADQRAAVEKLGLARSDGRTMGAEPR